MRYHPERLGNWVLQKVPAAALQVAKRRVQGLTHEWAMREPLDGLDLNALLASAYLQGVEDSAAALYQRGWLPPENT